MKTLVQKLSLKIAHFVRELKDIAYEAKHTPEERIENETPHQKKIRIFRPHKHLIQAIGSASAFMMFFFILGLGALLIARFAAITDFGRENIERNLDGLKMGKIGTLHLKGYDGDLFTEFSIKEMAIIDEKGAWLEGKNLKIDWSPIDILRSLIHVNNLKAERIIIHRAPQTEKNDKKLHFALEAEIIEAIVETKEAISVKRGEWALNGNFKIHHNHDFKAIGGIVSLNRPKDNAFIDIDMRKKHPLKLIVKAQEFEGGALSGLLGFDPNKSLLINAEIDALVEKGMAKVFVNSGGLEIIKLNGQWHETIGDINGRANLGVSRITQTLSEIIGQEVKITANWNTKSQNGLRNYQDFSANLDSENARISINGPIDFKSRSFVSPLVISANIAGFSPQKGPKMTAPSLKGNLSGGFDKFQFGGNFEIKNLYIDKSYSLAIRGPVSFKHENNSNDMKIALDGYGTTNRMPLSQIFGENPKLKSEISFENGLKIRSIEVLAKNGNLRGIGSKSLLGNFEVKGKAFVQAAAIFDNNVRGPMNGNFVLKQKSDLEYELLVDSKSNLSTDHKMLNDLFTKVTDLKMNISIGRQGVKLPSFEINAGQTKIKGSGTNAPNPFSKLIANVQVGEQGLDILGFDGTSSGAIEFSGLGEPAKHLFSLALKFDLNFKNFATPLKDLNSIIGSTPSASGVFFFEPDKILLGNGIAKGQIGNGTVNGQLLGPNFYALQGNWKINAPFKIAGFEIKGNPSGTALLRGKYDDPVLEIATIFNQFEFGSISLNNTSLNTKSAILRQQFPTEIKMLGNSAYGKIDSSATLVAVKNGANLRDIDIKGSGIFAKGDAQFIDGNDPILNLEFGMAKGLILESGSLGGNIKITGAKLGNHAIMAIVGKNAKFRGSDWEFANIGLSGQGKLDGLELKTAIVGGAHSPFKFEGTSTLKPNDKAFGFAFNGSGNFYGRNFTTNKPLELYFGPNNIGGNGALRFDANQKEQAGSLSFDFQNGEDTTFANARFENVNIALLDNDFAGTISGQLKALGKNNQFEGDFNGQIFKARPKGEKEDAGLSGKFNANLKNSILKLNTQAETGQGLDVFINGDFKAVSQVSPLRLAIDTHGPISGQVKINGEIKPLFNLAFAGERSLSGFMNLKSDFSGSLSKPLFDGNFVIEKGRLEEPSIGLSLNALTMAGKLKGAEINIPNFSAKDNKGGEIKGNGTFELGNQNSSNFDLSLKQFRLMETDNIKLEATGNVKIDSQGSKTPLMAGELNIDFAEFKPRAFEGAKVPTLDVIEINAPKKSNGNKAPNLSQILKNNQKSIFPEMRMNVSLLAPNGGVFVRGRGLNLELSLDAKALGSLGNPALEGIARVHKGEYEYGGRTFEFLESGQVHLSTKPENIRLNLTAERNTQSLLARIIVRGTAAAPEIELTSVPDLPKDEILAQVLFGRARSQLSPLETVQLATSLAALASGGGFDVMANLREIVRLDRLVFANTASGQISVAGGKYIGRNFYIELISEGSEGISTNVEWRPINSTAIVSKVKQGGDNKISIRWRRDFK